MLIIMLINNNNNNNHNTCPHPRSTKEARLGEAPPQSGASSHSMSSAARSYYYNIIDYDMIWCNIL